MRVAVIGGGIQGCCVSLEMAHRGARVELFEAEPKIMDGASRHSEGKIHLGFVYANDPTLKTARLMVRGAATFAPFVKHWVGQDFDRVETSQPFDYVVHQETMVRPEDLSPAYDRISALVAENIPDGAYFGVERPGRIFRAAAADLDGQYGPMSLAVFQSEEIAVDPEQVADLITGALTSAEGVAVLTSRRVVEVNRMARTLVVVEPGSSNETAIGPFDHVFNCAWGGRPLLDSTVGLPPARSWSFRMKYFLRTGELPGISVIRSSTIVLGPFGDIVSYGNGDWYLSWYPAGRAGWSTDLEAPSWPTRPKPPTARRIARETIENLVGVRPGLARAASLAGESTVRGGIIYALGETDIDDLSSGLHQRWEVGPVSLEGWYHSIDTGKYTLAPLFAKQAADRVLA